MDKELILNLQEENKNYQVEIKEIKKNFEDKKMIDTLMLIIVIAFSITIIFGDVIVYSKYFQDIISILLQEVFDVLPISGVFYLGSRLVTSLIYGFNNSNLKRLKNIQDKVKRNNIKIKKLDYLNKEKVNVNEETKTYTLEDYSYSDSLVNSPKVKKIGAIKR